MRRAARLAGAWLAIVFSPVALGAQEPAPPLAQWHHTAWTARDGLTGRPLVLAQTADGFLWIGTTGGLCRFDGVEFERVQPDNGELPDGTVSALAAVPDGSLWIGYTRGGVTRLGADGRATHYDRDERDFVLLVTDNGVGMDHPRTSPGSRSRRSVCLFACRSASTGAGRPTGSPSSRRA